MHKPKLLDRVRAFARVRHLSLRTEQAYSDWIRRFILYHQKRHPEQMGAEEIQLFLSHLAVEGQVSASTQNVALCALLFLYRDVLHRSNCPSSRASRGLSDQPAYPSSSPAERWKSCWHSSPARTD
jgi:site-specific recombinase XerD